MEASLSVPKSPVPSGTKPIGTVHEKGDSVMDRDSEPAERSHIDNVRYRGMHQVGGGTRLRTKSRLEVHPKIQCENLRLTSNIIWISRRLIFVLNVRSE